MSVKGATVVLIHGAWHSSKCWHKLIPLLEAQGHKVLAPDLPGHGLNDTPSNKISLKSYSRFVSQLINSEEENVILVGHSMAGMVISQVAEMIPEKIDQLIYICAFLPQNRQSVFDLMALEDSSEIQQALVMSSDKRSCTIKEDSIAALFYGQCSNTDLSFVMESFAPQASLPLANKVKLGQAYNSVKRNYICCRDDRVIPLSQQQAMLAKQACTRVLTLDSDHSPFLSNSVVLNSTLNKLICIKSTDP